MAVPSVGKCLVLLVLVLIIYTGYAFRIRDSVQSTNVEQSRTCHGIHGKCTADASSRTESSSSSAGNRIRFDGGSDGTRGRTGGKIVKPPVADRASEESTVDDDEDEHARKISSFSSVVKHDKWTAGQDRKIKFSRLVSKIAEEEEEDEGSEVDVVTEEIEDDDSEVDDDDDVEEINADEDDDGVQISDDHVSQEDSEEVIDADSEDGEDDDDEEEEEEDNDKVSAENDDSDDEEVKGKETDEDDKDDDGDDNKKNIIGQKVEALKSISRKRDGHDGEGSTDDDIKKNELSKQRKGVVNRKAKEIDDSRIVGDSKKKALMKKVKDEDDEDIKDDVDDEDDEDEEDDEDDEDDDDGEDDGKEKTPKVSATPVPPRKLEKVRLADKEKAKSVGSSQTVKSANQEPVIESKANTKATNEARPKKKTNIEEPAKATKIETEKVKPATTPKPETNLKTNGSLKKAKDASSKSETSKSTTIVDSSKVGGVKTEKVIGKTKDDKPVRKKSDKPSVKPLAEVKKSRKKSDVSGGVQDRTKSKQRTDAPISLTELNDAVLQAPTFMLNFTAVEDPICQQHGKIFLRQLRGYKLWALQMLDSSAKIPSGLLRGNVNQLGDFDQCLGIIARVKMDEKTVKVQGKYCLATFDVYASLPEMRVPVNFMQSRGFIRSSMRDPGHFIPRFTTANWALCIPAACSAEDARNAIQSALSHVNMTSGLRFTVDVNPEMCYLRQKSQTYTKETIGVLYFYAMIICLVLVATLRDYIVESQAKGNYSERIIMSFSLRRTLNILTKEENTSAGEISCIHGIRSLATIALYVAHKMIPASQIPYANRISLTEIANNPISSLLRASLAYTDCFLLLSGLLTAFNMARESTKRGEIRWFCRFVARFIRLTPALLVMVFWYAYVMEHTGSGPQWNRVIASNAELCKQNSWTNILYIQNFFPFEEMCATHTHQLALDMQLSLFAPILVFFLTFRPIIGILVVFFILLVSATVRYFATANNYLSLVIFHGISMKHLYKTANLTYALSLHRATPYVFGIGLGVLLHYTGKNVRIYRFFVIFGWLVAAILGSWCLFSPWRTARRDYIYDVEEAVHYSVIAPVAWSLSLCWVIFACFTNHGGIVNKFLSSYWMILFSRISYAVYLCQFAIFFYNVGTTRYASEFEVHKIIDPYEALVVTLVSIVLTLFIDIPMQEVKNVIMDSTDVLAMPINEDKTKAVTEESSAIDDIGSKLSQESEVLNKEEIDESRWLRRDDVTNGPTRLEDSEVEEPTEKWRRRSRSSSLRRSYVSRETYEDEEESYEEEEKDEEDEEDISEEWDWVKRTGSRISVADDGLVERGRSGQRGSEVQMIRQSSAHQYQKDDDLRRERRSLSRQTDRNLRYEESPRSSMKRERSTSRASESRISQSDARSSASDKHFSRQEPRGGSIQREYECTTASYETKRGDRSPKRDRSASRTSDTRTMEVEDAPKKLSRSDSRESFSVRERDWTTPSREISRHERSPSRAPMSPRRESVGLPSSGSEEEPQKNVPQYQEQRSSVGSRKKVIEPKVSDEEDWEQELRIRRRKFMERLASEDRDTKNEEANDGWNSVNRRSSAEGKLALLKDPTDSNVMDSWTVSRGPRVSLLGSSQETEDDASFQQSLKERRPLNRESSSKDEVKSDEESILGQTRRRSYTSESQVTSLEEEEEAEDVYNNDFVLNKNSARITVMDLSKLSDQEESSKELIDNEKGEIDDQPKMATLKLFKRESIIKSQASEEDPEYLLPERPKLMEQEQDHPFKKAWQLQKSRSEEDPTAYSLKEVKMVQDSVKNRNRTSNKDNDDNKASGSTKSSRGPQSTILENFYADSTDTTTVCVDRSFEVDDTRSSSKSTNDDSSRLE